MNVHLIVTYQYGYAFGNWKIKKLRNILTAAVSFLNIF